MILIGIQNQKTAGIFWACKKENIPVLMWDMQGLPPFDAVNLYKPKMIIIDKTQFNRPIEKIESKGVKILFTEDIPILANTVFYQPGQYRKCFESDLTVIGNQPEDWVRPLLYPIGKYNVKIFGSYKWRECIQYLGNLNQKEFSDACVSANYVLNVSDDPTLTYNIMAAGGIPIVANANDGNSIFDDLNYVIPSHQWELPEIIKRPEKNMPCQENINFAQKYSYIAYVNNLSIS